jgi:hypothetical protein
LRSFACASSSSAREVDCASSAIAALRRSISAGNVRALPHALSASAATRRRRGASDSCSVNCALGELRRLLLQLHVLDLDTRRLELLVCGKACLLGRAKIRAQRLQAVARTRERLFGGRAHGQLLGERRLDGRPVDARRVRSRAGRAGRAAGRDASARSLARRASSAMRSSQRRCAKSASCVLRSARTHFLAAARQRDLALRCGRGARTSRAASLSCKRGLQVGDLRIDGGRCACASSMRAASSPDSCSICARRFCAASAVCRSCMSSSSRSCARRCCDVTARPSAWYVCWTRGKLGVDRVALHARFLGPRTRARHRSVELVELALSRKHAVQFVIGREERVRFAT